MGHVRRRVGLYFWNILIGLDQLLNTLIGGDPDETISSRAAKNQHRWYWRALAKFLEWIDPGHMDRSLEEDEGEDAAVEVKRAPR